MYIVIFLVNERGDTWCLQTECRRGTGQGDRRVFDVKVGAGKGWECGSFCLQICYPVSLFILAWFYQPLLPSVDLLSGLMTLPEFSVKLWSVVVCVGNVLKCSHTN